MRSFSWQFILPVVALWTSQYLGVESWWVLAAVRAAFLAELVASVWAYVLVRRAIVAAADETVLTYVDTGKKRPKKKARSADEATITSTVEQYDMKMWRQEVNKVLIGSLLLGLVHWGFGSFTSLFVGVLTAPATLLESPLVQAHLLGAHVARPFTEPETMMQAVAEDWKAVKKELAAATAEATATPGDAADKFRREMEQEAARRRAAQAKRATEGGGSSTDATSAGVGRHQLKVVPPTR